MAERAWRGLGRSFQDARLFPALTVEETIAVALERWIDVRDPINPALRLPAAFDSEEQVRERVEELIDLFGLVAGLLALGVSPRRVWDARYRAFFDLVAGHIGTSLADARAP